jgi:D-ala D-ala ligase C-terminus
VNYLIYDSSVNVTGKQLGEWLQANGASDLLFGTEPNKAAKVDVLIRWGSQKLVGKPGKVVNQAKCIAKASNKLGALIDLAAAGVPTPKIVKVAPGIIPQVNLPCLGRATHHSHGTDIVLCLQKHDLRMAVTATTDGGAGCSHLSEYIPVAREFRIHVFDGAVIKISEKFLVEPDKYCPWMRNHDHGYHYMSPKADKNGRTPASVKVAAIEAIEALELDFGAVDVVFGDDGKAYVLEINTAPGLIEDGVERYGKCFLEKLK